MEKLNWTKYQDLSAITSLVNKLGPGVYKIARIVNGKPLPIARLLGTDEEGLLSIGETGELKRRLRQFNKSCQTPGNHHAGTLLFMAFGAASLAGQQDRLNPDLVQFSYAKLEDKQTAVLMEAELHSAYFTHFGELPPLNGKMGLDFFNSVGKKLFSN